MTTIIGWGMPSNPRTVFDYNTGYAYCPMCRNRLSGGWHLHRGRTFGLRTRYWWFAPYRLRINVRAWKIGTWVAYHVWHGPRMR